MTAQTAPSDRPTAWLLIPLGLWFALILSIALRGGFVEPVLPVPLRDVPAVALPPLIFWLAWWRLPALRRQIDRLDPALVAGAQAWRMLGTSFLLFGAIGMLPAVFAVVGGLGDISVGLLAVPTALAVARGRPGWPAALRRLTALGLVDFAVVFGLAVLSGPGLPLDSRVSIAAMQRLPLVLIPSFGVPLFIILHLIALLKLRQRP